MAYTDTEKDPVKLAARLQDAEVLVLTQQRSKMPRAVIEKLPKLKLISQTGGTILIDGCGATIEGSVATGAAGRSPRARRPASCSRVMTARSGAWGTKRGVIRKW